MDNIVRILRDGKTALVEAVNKVTINGMQHSVYAWVDTDLLCAIGKFKAWRAVASDKTRAAAGDLSAYYFQSRLPDQTVGLHQVVMMAHDPATVLTGFVVDHKNGHTLDCKVRNLQVVTCQVNVAKQRLDSTPRKSNTTGVRNVTVNKATGRFHVRVASKHRGSYDTLEEAKMFAQHYREETNIARTGRP